MSFRKIRSSRKYLKRMVSTNTVSRVDPNGSAVSLSSTSTSPSLTNLTRKTRSKAPKGVVGRNYTPPRSSKSYVATRNPRIASARHGKSKATGFSPSSTSIEGGWAFSALALSREELKTAATQMLLQGYRQMYKNKITGELKRAIAQLVDAIAERYHRNNFHNFTHAVDVCQMTYFLCKTLKTRLRRHEMFFLCVAALCHDMAHPGADTTLLREQGILSSKETLEAFHIQKTRELINDPSMTIFNGKFITESEKLELLRYAECLIQATDIGKHKEYLDDVKAKKLKNKENLDMIHLCLLIKVSDLANVAREVKDAHSWSENLAVEFRAIANFKRIDAQNLFPAPAPLEDVTISNCDQLMLGIHSNLSTLQERVREQEATSLNDNLATNTENFIHMFAGGLREALESICDKLAEDYQKRLDQSIKYWKFLKIEHTPLPKTTSMQSITPSFSEL